MDIVQWWTTTNDYFTSSNTCVHAQFCLRILGYTSLMGREASLLALECFHLFFLLSLREVSMKAQIPRGHLRLLWDDSSKTYESVPGIINAMDITVAAALYTVHSQPRFRLWITSLQWKYIVWQFLQKDRVNSCINDDERVCTESKCIFKAKQSFQMMIADILYFLWNLPWHRSKYGK